MHDLEGKILAWNRGAKETYGYTEAEAVEMNIRDIVPESDREAALKLIQKITQGEIVKSFELQRVTKDGRILDVWLTTTLLTDKEGKPVAVATTERDITERNKTETALKRKVEELHRLATVVSDSNDAVIMHDLEGKILAWNRGARETYGYTEAEALGKNVRDIVAEPDREAALKLIERITQGEIVKSFELRRATKDRRILDVWLTTTLLTDENGKPVAIATTERDITANKQADEALRESEVRYRSLFESMLEGVALHRLICDDEGHAIDYEIVDVNPAYALQTGLSIEIAKGSRASLLYGSSTPPYLEIYEKVARDGAPASFESYFAPLGRHFQISVFSPKAGWFATVFTDITERNKAEEKQRAVLLYTRNLIEANLDPMVIISADGLITDVNGATEEITGVSRERLVGSDFSGYFTEPEKAYAVYKKVFSQGIVRDYPLTICHRSGRTIDVLYNAIAYRNDAGEVQGVFAAARDITEIKRAEAEHENLEAQFRQAQKMEAVGRLAGGVAHDFNNMLQVIISYAELSLEKLTPSDVLYAPVQQILKAGRRSADLTGQLLAFARKQTIAPKVLDLNESIGGMLKMLKRLIGEDIDLAMMPGYDVGKVMMDPSQLDQILANLAVNARDAISSVGKVTIETDNVEFDDSYCLAHAGFLPGQYVLLAVSDDGCGMDKETQSRLFEPFFTTKPQGQGTGLGLSTVYGIVKQNNGFIAVYSEPGKGTAFKIYLPRLQSDRAVVDETPTHAVALNGTETVLLVDDEEALLGLGKLILEEQGYTALAAGSPSQAMQLAEQYAGVIHLLLTDVVMPEMSGRELFQRLSIQRPSLKCLFMSGYTANTITQRGVLNEGIHFLQKPFSVEQLAVKLRETLDGP
jgi:PAS domain S-box-containing protein